MNKRVLLAPLVSVFTTACLATTCPTQLVHEHDGYWVSTATPGWKSSEKTAYNDKINTKDFGGAIYSPSEKRIACVFRSSKGFWVAMISHMHKKMRINKHVLNDAKTHVAWKWDSKHKDFSCGRPDVTSPSHCEFTIN